MIRAENEIVIKSPAFGSPQMTRGKFVPSGWPLLLRYEILDRTAAVSDDDFPTQPLVLGIEQQY
jgi:hypothetical protein